MILKPSKSALVLAAFAIGITSIATAEGRDREEWRHARHEMEREFRLGICVGQSLAQQGVSLPAQPDSATVTALEDATRNCYEQLTGATPSPSPSLSPSASPEPSPAPSPTPTAEPSPAPTEAPSPAPSNSPVPSSPGSTSAF